MRFMKLIRLTLLIIPFFLSSLLTTIIIFLLLLKLLGNHIKINRGSPSRVNSCLFKNRLHRRYLRNPSVANERFYKTYRNCLTATTRSAKKRYYADKLDHHKGNLKSMCREINGILGKPKESTLPASFTMDGDHFVSQSNDISDSFNKFFTNIGSSLAKTIPSSSTHFSDYINLHNPNGFSFFLTNNNGLYTAHVSTN